MSLFDGKKEEPGKVSLVLEDVTVQQAKWLAANFPEEFYNGQHVVRAAVSKLYNHRLNGMRSQNQGSGIVSVGAPLAGGTGQVNSGLVPPQAGTDLLGNTFQYVPSSVPNPAGIVKPTMEDSFRP